MRDFLKKIPAGTGQIALVAIVVLGAFGVSELLKPRQSRSGPPPAAAARTAPVTLIQPSVQSFQPVVSLTGVVENRTRTDISAQVGGRVVRVSPNFATGALVRQGSLLFEIDPVDYELALQSTAAEVAAAESDLERLNTEASLAIREWHEVYPDREPPALTARRPQIAAANARLMAAQANEQKAKLSLERTKVRAPFDARILQTQLDVGQVVNPNQPVGAAYALASIEIVASASTDEIDSLRPLEKRTATFAITGGGATVRDGTGRISRTDAALDPRTRLGRIFISPDDASGLIVGEFASLLISGETIPNAMRLPASAVSGRSLVWVAKNGVLAARNVHVLGEQNGDIIVHAFDIADGVVRVPPPGAADGLPVLVNQAAERIAAGGGSSGGR